jgi:hypothetical protein
MAFNRFDNKKMKQIILILLLISQNLLAQTPTDTKVSAYIGVVHPIYTIQKSKVTTNFKDYYQMGMTTAVIVRKAKNYAYNLEVVGFIRAQDGVTRMNNLMLHPGVTFYKKKDWALTPRFGFETSGRFGPTLVVSKAMAKLGGHPLNFNLVNLLRFGNDQGAAFTHAINITFGF